jgi:hypothetical protein
LAEELAEKVVVREGERTYTIPKQRAVIKALLNRAMKGDVRSGSSFFNLMFRVFGPEIDSLEGAEPLSNDEQELLDGLEQRRTQRAAQSAVCEGDQEPEREP